MKKKIKYLLGTLLLIGMASFILYFYWNSQPYYKKYHYIAHALGGIDDKKYTNSKEAMEYSYSMGNRLMEVDLVLTSDKQLVARHKWSNDLGDNFSDENIPDSDTFLSSKIYEKYTPVDIKTIILFAMEHPDVYFITDIKSYKNEMMDMLEIIKDTSNELGFTDFTKRFIIQVYNYENYELVNQNFQFENYIFTLYRMVDVFKDNQIDQVIQFCVDKQINVITIPQKYITKEIAKKAKESDILIYVNTINSRKEMLKLRLMGVNGVYTDFIYTFKIVESVIKLMALGIGIISSVLTLIYFVNRKKKCQESINVLQSE